MLKLKDCIFVNLQYGECEDELQRIESEVGINILRWDDVDLKNNQEQLAALISCLNIVVTAGTAVLGISMALGTKTIVFRPRGWDFLGQSNYPWSPYVESLSPVESSDLSSVVPKIVKILLE